MNKMSAFLMGLLIAASSTGFATTYTCEVDEALDAWSKPQDNVNDIMTVKIDLQKGTVEVSSSNELYGKNPYMVLTTAPARIALKYVKGTEVFAGANIHDRTSNILTFNPRTKTGSLEITANKQLSISDLKCR